MNSMKAYLQAVNRVTNRTERLPFGFTLPNDTDALTETLENLPDFDSTIIDPFSIRNAHIVLSHDNSSEYRVAYGFRTKNGKREAYRIELVSVEDES